jgi:cytosine/adenosine deaminase-related metal-dependent hydrolase
VVLRARWVVPVAAPPLENGWVRVAGGRIVALGRRVPAGAVVDLGDVAILPGLVNAHTHLEFSLRDTPHAAAGGLPAWIGRVVAERRARPASAGAAEHAAAIAAGLAESLRHGVTTIGEIATALPEGGYPRGGPRLRVYREALGLGFPGGPLPGGVCRDLDRLGATGGVSPHAPYTVPAALGRALLEAAARRRLPATMHLAEGLDEATLVAGGTGPFRDLLERLGAWPAVPPRLLPASEWIGRLARLPRASVVHGTFLGAPPDGHALERLALHRARIAVVICPRTTRHLSGRLPPLDRFRAAGVRVALGTDGRGSNPDLDPLAEARELAGAGLATPEEALAMATRDAAWALGMERVAGVLRAGAPADLAVVGLPGSARDPHEALLRPDARRLATLRAGRWLHGGVPG